MGPEMRQFEAELAAFGQATHALACANGTDALVLPLMAWGIGPRRRGLLPELHLRRDRRGRAAGSTPSRCSSTSTARHLQHRPGHLEAAIEAVKAEGRLTPRVVIAVDLFGQPADYPAIAGDLRHGTA